MSKRSVSKFIRLDQKLKREEEEKAKHGSSELFSYR